ncbi:MAG: HAMP domain-containing histidine kinase [Bacteroidetes bacterium]|nr:HAMP domain-containing histidine kinase [Bacteroidota bacterium]
MISQLSLIFIVTLSCFGVVDLISGFYFPLPVISAGILAGVLVLLLNRSSYFLAAKIVLTIATNFIALYFSYHLVRDLGVFIFSICINIGVIAVYGSENLKLAILIILISTGAFIFTMFFQHDHLPIPSSPNYIDRNLAFSFLGANIGAITIVYYFLQANLKAENALVMKEKSILDKNKELIKVNTELDKFFYSASHDLRAPLTSIQGLIQLMEVSNNLDELKQYTSMLKGRAQNLEVFIKKISEYSSNARQEIKMERVMLKSIMKESLENLRFYPQASKIKVQMEVPDKTEVFSDPVRLQIIFGNILSNAIKYHDFTKSEPYIRISIRESGAFLVIVIEDNGSGIREENLKNIFGMFYRAHRHAEGTGLGLFIVKEAIEKIHGRIEVTSQYGQGTTFFVSIPKAAIS